MHRGRTFSLALLAGVLVAALLLVVARPAATRAHAQIGPTASATAVGESGRDGAEEGPSGALVFMVAAAFVIGGGGGYLVWRRRATGPD